MSIDFLGRLHPLIVHLPIGIYALVFFLQYLAPKKTRENREVISLGLLVGWISALLSVLLGWLLSLSGDYNEQTVFTHKWSAVIFTLLGGILYLLQGKAKEFSLSKKIYHVVFFGAMVMITVTGHYGGNLTHGEGYLFSSSSEESVSEAEKKGGVKTLPIDPTSATVFGSLVEPVLEAKCVQCHNEKKKKGGFRMDEFEWLMKGGKKGKSILPGNAMSSELIKRMLLPVDDNKHMPPKGKRQLTEKEIALIYWWVNHGAAQDVKASAFANNDTLKPFLAVSGKKPEIDSLPVVPMPDSLAVLALKKAGFKVEPISLGSGLLQVSAINMSSLTNDDLKLLSPLSLHIYWLELSHKDISDQSISLLSGCKNLVRLDLKNTQVTGRIAKDLLTLTALEYVNLVGTGFDDEGLNALKSLKHLAQVYCWGSKVTISGAEQFMKMKSGVVVNVGINK